MPRRATSWRVARGSLHWRFLVIGIAALAPLSAALVQFAGDERKMAMKATRERAELLVSYVVDNQSRVLGEATAALQFLANSREVAASGAECSASLVRHVRVHRWMDSLRVFTPEGDVLCSTRGEASMSNVAGSTSFRQVLQGAQFVLSDLTVDETGALGMTAAAPVLRDGRIVGVLAAGVKPGVFESHSPIHIDPDLDTNMLLVDSKGTLIAHYPPLPEFVGAALRDTPVVQKALQVVEGNAEVEDLAGVSRLYVFRKLPGTDAILAVGLNRATVIGAIDDTLRYRLFLITVIIGGSLLLGMLGVEGLILRPLRSIVRTAEALEHGDFSAETPHKGIGEVRILERAFNRMAQAVADRERELMAAKEIAEEALSRANIASKAKTDFLASMSHEIRTPLNGIIGYTDQLLDEKLSEKQHRYASLIQVSASALLTVANDILDFSSIEADQIKLQIEPFSLISLVDNTVSIVTSGAGKKGVPIRVELSSGVPRMVLGDEARLRQILLNLLNNAVKFTHEGQITALVQHKGTTEEGAVIRISIIDTGIGISPEKHDRLFKRFSQVDPSIRREFGGTGLGLAISKRLVELMGGKIGVESEAGKGSTFWIELVLPVSDSKLHPQLQAPNPLAAVPANILLVEDVEINQELVRMILEAGGHRVDIVSSGEEAISAVQAKAYDLVFMDIQMPGMDGMTATRRIRELVHPCRRVFIVAMTANVLPQQVRSFIEAGIDDHIGKPVRRDQLLRKLGEWLPAANCPQPREESFPDSLSFDEGCFEDFRKTIGAERLHQWIARFDEQLTLTFAGEGSSPATRGEIAKWAHSLIPQAALLGFSELAERCTALERACISGQDISASLELVCLSARKAQEVLTRIEYGLTPA